MPRTAPHRAGVTIMPGFHGDMGMLAVLRQRHLRIEIPARWSATEFNGPSLGPSFAPGTRVARGSVVQLVPVPYPLGSPGVAIGSHTVPSVVGLPLSAAVSLIEHNEVAWQVAAPSLAARVPPSDLFDAYCVTSQSPSSGTVVTYPKQSTEIRLEVAASPTS
jgi:beta-lactam-binding protein with PASTA domain